MNIARDDTEVKSSYCIRLLMPNGWVVEVHSYGLHQPKRAIRRTRELADVLTRTPGPADFAPFVRAWLDAVEVGIPPRACRAELAERAPAGDDAPNGWRSVLVVEPAGVTRRV